MQVNIRRGVVSFKALSVDRRRVADSIDVVDVIERNIKGRDPAKHAIAEATLAGLREIEKWIAEPVESETPLFDQNKSGEGEGDKTNSDGTANVEGATTVAEGAETNVEGAAGASSETTAPNGEVAPAEQHEETGGGRRGRRKSGDHSPAS